MLLGIGACHAAQIVHRASAANGPAVLCSLLQGIWQCEQGVEADVPGGGGGLANRCSIGTAEETSSWTTSSTGVRGVIFAAALHVTDLQRARNVSRNMRLSPDCENEL